MMRLFTVFGVVLAMVFGSTAFAIDIRNEDQIAYTVQVESSAMTRDIQLGARSMSIVICVGECTFHVPGVGRIAASGSDVVTIRNGRLERRTPPPRVADSKPSP